MDRHNNGGSGFRQQHVSTYPLRGPLSGAQQHLPSRMYQQLQRNPALAWNQQNGSSIRHPPKAQHHVPTGQPSQAAAHQQAQDLDNFPGGSSQQHQMSHGQELLAPLQQEQQQAQLLAPQQQHQHALYWPLQRDQPLRCDDSSGLAYSGNLHQPALQQQERQQQQYQRAEHLQRQQLQQRQPLKRNLQAMNHAPYYNAPPKHHSFDPPPRPQGVNRLRSVAAIMSNLTPAVPNPASGRKEVCEYPGCAKQAHFAAPGVTHPSWCTNHMVTGMLNTSVARCTLPGCYKAATFSVPGNKRPTICCEHSTAGMTDTTANRNICRYPGCQQKPVYGGSVQHAHYCSTHKSGSMVLNTQATRQAQRRVCQQSFCAQKATFALPGQPPCVCARHMTTGMVDATQKYCQVYGCEGRPTFADIGKREPILCLEHKMEGMIDIGDSLCQHPGCSKRPLFAMRHEAAARFCPTHKQIDMVNMEERHCILPGCNGRPMYVQEACWDSGPFYCMAHHEVDMVALGKKRRRH